MSPVDSGVPHPSVAHSPAAQVHLGACQKSESQAPCIGFCILTTWLEDPLKLEERHSAWSCKGDDVCGGAGTPVEVYWTPEPVFSPLCGSASSQVVQIGSDLLLKCNLTFW